MSKLLEQYSESFRTTLSESKTQLQSKEVEVPEETKLVNIPDLIEQIDNGSKVELVITASDYEGQELTATKGGKSFKGTVTEGVCTIPVDEEGWWKVSADDGCYVEIKTQMSYEAQLEKSTVYGVKIIETESDPEARVIYTDNAIGKIPVKVNLQDGSVNYNGWDQYWIFDKIYPVMLMTNGTLGYKLNPDDQTKKEAGGASEITSTSYDGNAMVCVEKFYTKFGMSGSNETIQISDNPKDGFEPIGFVRSDGSVADKIYLPMFMGSYDSSSKLRSLSGQDVKYSVSWTDFRTAAQKNGSNYDIDSWAMNQALSALFIILMKSCNPKTALGEGRAYPSAKTGILVNKGPIAYDPSTKTTKFMWVEDFTSNYSSGMYRWEAGILSTNNKLYVKMKPPYSGTSTSGYNEVTDAVGIQGKCLSKMKCSNKYGRYPIEGNGTDSTHECSYWHTQTNSSICISLRATAYGVWGRLINATASGTHYDFGAALSYLPPA